MIFRAYSRGVSTVEGVKGWFESLEIFKKYSDFRDSRKVLFSINLIIAVCSLCLAGFSAYLAGVLYDPKFISGWINWLGLSIVGLLLAVVCIIGMRGAHLVSLDLLLTYFWGITVFVAPLLLGIIACFDFYSYMSVWFTHQWEEANFAGVRRLFCPPLEPALSKCAAPLKNPTEWCQSKYNSTDCGSIRDTAIATSLIWGRQITLGQAIVSICDLLLIGGSLFFCYRLLKRNVIAQSMNDVINYLLVLPIGGCVGIAYYLWWLRAYPPDRLQYSWLASLFAALAVTQVCALPLGIAAGRLKSQYLLTAYMMLVLLITTGLALGGTIALLFSGLIGETFQPSSVEIGDIACRKVLNGCCCCNEVSVLEGSAVNRCPEWGTDEVISLLVLDLKIAGIVAFVSLLYLFGAMIVAFLVQQSLENYKSEYIGVGRPRRDDEQPAATGSAFVPPILKPVLPSSIALSLGTAGSLVAGVANDFAEGVHTVGSGFVEGVGLVGGAVRSSIEGGRSYVGTKLGSVSDSGRMRRRGGEAAKQVQWALGPDSSDKTASLAFVLPSQVGVLASSRQSDADRLTTDAQRELEEWLDDWQARNGNPLGHAHNSTPPIRPTISSDYSEIVFDPMAISSSASGTPFTGTLRTPYTGKSLPFEEFEGSGMELGGVGGDSGTMGDV